MKSWKLWQIVILGLLGLGILSSQFMPELWAQNHQKELLELSVMLRDPESTTWSNTRQGMEQSALDWGVELRFLTLSHSNSTQEQVELFTREVEGGADGVILAPCSVEALTQVVSDVKDIPIVTLESDMSEQGAVACIAPDQTALGITLAQSAESGLPTGSTVLLVNSAPDSQAITQRLESAQTHLTQAGHRVVVYTPMDWLDLSLYLNATIQSHRPQVVMAFEPQVTEVLADVASKMSSAPLIYGVGSTARIASYLEQGVITAIAIQNEYATGYLAVETAVLAIRKQMLPQLSTLDVSLIRRETMYQPQHERILFPVT